MRYFASGVMLLLAISLADCPTVHAQNTDDFYYEENSACLECHGSNYFSYYNDWIERDVRERMNPFYVVDSAEFYESNHNTFQCIDCHSMDYEEFPHPNYLRYEPMYECQDCHAGDDDYAHYNFELIQEEFEMSVHSTNHAEEFTCWMCHDPHSYKISARTDLPITEVITYDNDICLSCHADIDRYQLLTTGENPNIITTHDWLPNQEAHFRFVRCIECHAEQEDDLLVAHKIKPKEDAVKLCVECHSRNSILMASLYKHEAKERRSKFGFFNAAILAEGYVIGANANPVLDIGSIIIFALVLAGISIHYIIWRISRKK
jgi:hypothetical protein